AIPSVAFGYDIENRIATANPTGLEEVYAYGKGNRRVYDAHWQYNGTKYNLISEKVNFYSVTGQKLGTYQLQLNTAPPGPASLKVALLETRVWFGKKLVMLNGTAVTPDRLGSFGTYYPYGEDRGTGNPPADREKFATYTRDSVTGLDYAVNRYYNSVSGRFLTPDPYGKSSRVTSPSSFNRYAYALDDPINSTDPSGLVDWPRIGKGIVRVAGGAASTAVIVGVEIGSDGILTPVVAVTGISAAANVAIGISE